MPSNKKLLQAAAGSAGGDKLYVEDVFSTYIYDAAHGTSPIVNGINLADDGGMVWFKHRTATYSNILFDTERGTSNHLVSNTTAGNATSIGLGSFNTNGFSFSGANLNVNSAAHVAWSFRKAEGFCDIVTYTGDGTSGRNISHNLGSRPAFVMIKRTDAPSSWAVWVKIDNTRALTALNLNTTSATGVSVSTYWMDGMTSSVISLTKVADNGSGNTHNVNGGTYVAYLFGDEAIFGEDADEQICKMGSYTADSSNAYFVNLGFEPQWVMIKKTSGTGDWELLDTMRGFGADAANDEILKANSSNAEASDYGAFISSTGFYGSNQSGANGSTYIYMAIRRPMKVPEAGTEVFQPLTYSGTGTFPNGTDPNSGVATRTISSSLGFDVDMSITKWRSGGSGTPAPSSSLMDRFRGIYNELFTYERFAESQSSNTGPRFSTRASRAFDLHDYGVEQLNKSGQALVSYVFKRAPKFFDMVAYTGNGSVRTINHNLQVAPDLMIVKCRSAGSSYWVVYDKTGTATDYMYLDSTNAQGAFSGYWNNTEPTSTVFTLGTGNGDDTNASSKTYIAYLFATLAGISKVGTYTGTGTGTTVNVDCGFSNGARFILIKRTDATGDWFVYDSSRGINSGDSPYFLFNTAAQEVNTDYIDPLSTGVPNPVSGLLCASKDYYIY